MQQTLTSSGFMRREPKRTAQRAPNCAPRKAASAIASASGQMIAPLREKTDNAPRLQAAFKSLLDKRQVDFDHGVFSCAQPRTSSGSSVSTFLELIGEYTSLKCYSFSLRSTQISKGLACKGYGLALLWVEIQVGSFGMRH